MIEKLFNDVDLFFQGKHEEKETHYFAFYVQDYLCDNYDEMYKENAEVTEFLNEDLPEITDIAEYGDDKRNEEFNLIEKLFKEIELAINKKHKYNSLDFSLYLEDFLCDNYDEMYKENAEVTEFLNEDLPDICAEMNLGIDDKPFLDKLSQ